MSDTIVVRRGRGDDAASIARVHVESWRSTYAGMLPKDMLLKLSSADHEARWWRHVLGRFRRRHYVYVAEHETDGVIGFISGGPARESGLDPEAEIYALYLLDEFQGEGVGRALFLRLANRLNRECGPSLVVWVLSENPSRYFYEAMGGRRIGRRSERMGGAEVQETAYGWADMAELVAVGRSGQE
ncbi:MAG: GNAT family N-acetyltransferase [Proteobacteria bacterium]|nr:GNAT family N-acetyltransferase [Pseudomonadota bacterium]